MPKYKLVVFDMDGTLLETRSCWAHIHEHFGTDNSDMLKLYINHKITDEEFVLADINLWQSKSERKIDEYYINSLLDEIKPMEGAGELIEFLHRNDIKTAIISGGIQYLADKWAKKWKMHFAIANELIDDKNGKLMFKEGASGNNKGPVIDRLVKNLNLKKENIVAVGDTIVDIPLFERSGLSIAVNTKDKRVIKKADYHHKEKNLEGLMNLIKN